MRSEVRAEGARSRALDNNKHCEKATVAVQVGCLFSRSVREKTGRSRSSHPRENKFKIACTVPVRSGHCVCCRLEKCEKKNHLTRSSQMMCCRKQELFFATQKSQQNESVTTKKAFFKRSPEKKRSLLPPRAVSRNTQDLFKSAFSFLVFASSFCAPPDLHSNRTKEIEHFKASAVHRSCGTVY